MTASPAQSAPIELYYWPTTNGMKVTLLLEELGLAYMARLVNIRQGEQHHGAFQALSASGRIPAIVDPAPEGGGAVVRLFESNAILWYLAEKAGALLGAPPERHVLNQWMFWQAAQQGPTLGKLQMLREKAPQPFPWLMERLHTEALRVYATLNRQLAGKAFLLGEQLSIADIAIYPWVLPERQGIDMAGFANLQRWHEQLHQRPAFQIAYEKGRAAAADEPAVQVKIEPRRAAQ